MTADRLPDELRALGSSVRTPVDSNRVADAVVSRIVEPEPDRTRSTRPLRRPLVAAVAAAVIAALVLTPPVRAAVADFFGIVVESGPELEDESVRDVDSDLTVNQAAAMIDFEPVVPRQFDVPDGVGVSDDHRVLSMSWSLADGTVRLDEFDGEVAPGFVKRTDDVEFVTLATGGYAMWFESPHEVLPLGEDGDELMELARSAGPTLVWSDSGVTLRLEGLDQEDAIDLAEDVLRNQ